jgi:hypothetical protein
MNRIKENQKLELYQTVLKDGMCLVASAALLSRKVEDEQGDTSRTTS